MLIIRINADLTAEDHARAAENIRAQAETGLIILPFSYEVLANMAPGFPAEAIQIIRQKDDERVAALEAQLARALSDLANTGSCETCAHEPINPYTCFETGYACGSSEETGCICRDCYERDKWEWRGSRGAE